MIQYLLGESTDEYTPMPGQKRRIENKRRTKEQLTNLLGLELCEIIMILSPMIP